MQTHSIYEILSVQRAGSMCTVHYRIKTAMRLPHNYIMRDRTKYEQHVEATHNAIKYVTKKIAQTCTHLTHITTYPT
jgi:hypothetical protein